jgi:hypothetical protein
VNQTSSQEATGLEGRINAKSNFAAWKKPSGTS